MNTRIPTALLAVALALTSACGDTPTTSTDAAGAPNTTVAGDEGDVPQRIVSMGPTATEMLFAVGAGDQVVAAEEHSDFPPEAPDTDLSAFTPNVEAIAAYDPDLVMLTNDQDEIVAQLEAVGIETLLLPAPETLDDVYAEIAEVGVVTGHEDGAAEVVATMRTRIDELVAQVPERPEPLTYFHDLGELYTVTSETFIGEVYDLAGLENVADGQTDGDAKDDGYLQLSSEVLVSADPDVVFVGEGSTEAFVSRPGFAQLSAVEDDRIVELPPNISSRWGPRLVDFLAVVVEATTTVPVG